MNTNFQIEEIVSEMKGFHYLQIRKFFIEKIYWLQLDLKCSYQVSIETHDEIILVLDES